MKQHKPIRVTGKYAAFFKDEVQRYGREVAIFNVGFLKGWDNGKKKAKARLRRK